MMNFERCSEDSNDPLIVVDEHGCKFRIQNRAREYVKKVKVDGCLIDDERIRCDHLFEVGQACYCVIYLELKRSDLEHAFRQLVATMGYLVHRHKAIKKICHIVKKTRFPRPKIQNLKSQMVKQHRALLLIGTKEVTIDIEHELYRDP